MNGGRAAVIVGWWVLGMAVLGALSGGAEWAKVAALIWLAPAAIAAFAVVVLGSVMLWRDR